MINFKTQCIGFYYRFILVAAIAYSSNHYMTFVKRANNIWELHNDLEKQTKRVYQQKITPHILMYIQE